MEHPITPPPELVREWRQKWTEGHGEFGVYLATQAARWGADTELDACLKWLNEQRWTALAIHLRAARRPKPPSLKEQALAVVENSAICDHLSPEHQSILRRALEALSDD